MVDRQVASVPRRADILHGRHKCIRWGADGQVREPVWYAVGLRQGIPSQSCVFSQLGGYAFTQRDAWAERNTSTQQRAHRWDNHKHDPNSPGFCGWYIKPAAVFSSRPPTLPLIARATHFVTSELDRSPDASVQEKSKEHPGVPSLS